MSEVAGAELQGCFSDAVPHSLFCLTRNMELCFLGALGLFTSFGGLQLLSLPLSLSLSPSLSPPFPYSPSPSPLLPPPPLSNIHLLSGAQVSRRCDRPSRGPSCMWMFQFHTLYVAKALSPSVRKPSDSKPRDGQRGRWPRAPVGSAQAQYPSCQLPFPLA